MSRFLRQVLFAALCLLLFRVDAHAQASTYTLAVRNVDLADAIERFVEATGLAVSYEPDLVRGRTTSCAAEAAEAEAVLRCILGGTGLDFYRLSSGTYVLAEEVELRPEHGYLAGRVVDADTGHPLPGAHVLLADAGAGTVTDRTGRFTLPSLLPGSYVVTVSHVGYRSWTDSLVVAPREQTQTEAVLESGPVFITPVVVDGSNTETPARRLGRPAVDAPDLGEAAPGAYRDLPVLQGVRLSHTTADVHVQGGDPGAHQLRLDGVPVFLPWRVAAFAGPFSSFALERITVHKAGFGAAEGSHLSGVVEVEHALAPAREGPTADVDAQVDAYSANARIRAARGSAAAMVSGRMGLWDVVRPARLQATLEEWSRPDVFLLPVGLEGFEELLDRPTAPALQYVDLHAAGRLRSGPLRSLHASLYHGRQSLGGGVLSGSDVIVYQNQLADFTVLDDYRWTNTLGQLRYDAVLGSRTLASVQARVSRYKMVNGYETLDSLHTTRYDGTIHVTSLATSPARDVNSVSTAAVETSLDHARGPHEVKIGLEAGSFASRFQLQSVYFPDAWSTTVLSGFSGTDSPAHSRHDEGILNTAAAAYLAAFAEDRIRLGDRVHAELGARLTYLGPRQTVYAEPRAALVVSGSLPAGAWGARTSGGIYRQFLNQFDASKLNAGTLLSSVRTWLPADAGVRPPMAYHLAQEAVLRLAGGWSVHLEGYLKHQPHGLALAYVRSDGTRLLTGAVDQSAFLVHTRGRTTGGSIELARRTAHVNAAVRYSREHARRESPALFHGRRHDVPWSEPHRVEARLDWRPVRRAALSLRWKGVWGRSWGFRRVYYDYFGHGEQAVLPSPGDHAIDLSAPDAHVLPPLYQLDATAAFTQPVGGLDVQLRLEVVNVLGRRNVMDWRLVRDGATWRSEPTHLFPFMPSFAVRIHGL